MMIHLAKRKLTVLNYLYFRKQHGTVRAMRGTVMGHLAESLHPLPLCRWIESASAPTASAPTASLIVAYVVVGEVVVVVVVVVVIVR